LKTGLAGLPGFFRIFDELEKSSMVCPGSRTLGIARDGAIRTWSFRLSVQGSLYQAVNEHTVTEKCYNSFTGY
jgi:hypothetical protein